MECADARVFSDIAGLENLPIVLPLFCLDIRFVLHNRGICPVSSVLDGVKSVAELCDITLLARNHVSHEDDAKIFYLPAQPQHSAHISPSTSSYEDHQNCE
jgi:hypothetical protein